MDETAANLTNKKRNETTILEYSTKWQKVTGIFEKHTVQFALGVFLIQQMRYTFF